MIYCKHLDKHFTDKKAMLAELWERKDEIISLKKATIKRTDDCGYFIQSRSITKSEGEERTLQIGDTITNVINTTNYLDSHDDVHLPGIWDKSSQEQNGKTYHAVDHELKVGSVVGYPSDVKIEVRRMPWRDLGLDAEGLPDALLFHTTLTDKTNVDAFKAYRDNAPVQHSIRMQYVRIALAINDPENKEAYSVWQQYLPSIINREKAEQQGYFFAVHEAKIYKEGSTVLFGSNDITPSLGFKDNTQHQPLNSTEKEPPFDFVAMCKDFKLLTN